MTLSAVHVRITAVAAMAGLLSSFHPLGAEQASAAPRRADVAVEVTASPRTVSRWHTTVITAVVRNLGNAPARGVTLTLNMPAPFAPFQTTSLPDWNCKDQPSSWTCEHDGPIAPGSEFTVLRVETEVIGATPGDQVDARGTVTTRSLESDTSNNEDVATANYQGVGVLRGQAWHDLNRDGQRTPDEPAVGPGFDGIDSIIFVALDDGAMRGAGFGSDGYAEEMPANRYRVEVLVASGRWDFTTADVGDDRSDSDIVSSTVSGIYRRGSSADVTLTEGGEVVVDIGLVPVS